MTVYIAGIKVCNKASDFIKDMEKYKAIAKEKLRKKTN